MPQEDRGARLSIARDIADLLAAFIRERNLRVPLESRVLLEYVQEKSPRECEEHFKKLFRMVVEELCANRVSIEELCANRISLGELYANRIPTEEELCTGRRIPGRAGISDHVRLAMDFMLDRYAQDISLEETASALKISPSYLSRLYKRETGFSFVDGLNRIRVDAAKVCLLDGTNLKQTASLCGFRYYNYFIKVFKDHTGLTPADFPRREHDKIL
jgi:YesN/AraC family two-component response regulator